MFFETRCISYKLTWITSCIVGISNITRNTLTSGAVRSNETVSIHCAVARINTMFVAACEHLRTIVVHNTLWLAANLVRVAEILWRTHANGPMVASFANCVHTALLVRARVLAFAVDTGLRKRAFKVALTSS